MTINTKKIWKDFSSSLNEVIVKIVPEEQIAGDITKDILTQINHQIKTLDDQQKIIAWFEEILNDIVIVYAEKNQIDYTLENGNLMSIKDSSFASLSPFIALLHDKHQSVLQLSQRATIKEIAEKLGMSISATKNLLSEAKNHLSRMIYLTYLDFNPELKALAY